MGDDKTWQEFVSTVLTRRLDRMFSLRAEVTASSAIEPVHQMRVWSRRARSAFELLRSCEGSKESRKLEAELKRIGATLSRARDLDVMIENLDMRAAKLPEEQRSGLHAFIGRLSAQRLETQSEVEQAMLRIESKHLPERFHTLLSRWSK